MNNFKKLMFLVVALALLCSNLPVARAQEERQSSQTQVFLPIAAGSQSKIAEEQISRDSKEVQASSTNNILDKLPPEIKDIANTAKTITEIYSGVGGIIDIATTLGKVLGILDSGPTMSELFEKLSNQIAGVDWKVTKSYIDQARSHAIAAIGEIKEAISTGQVVTPNTPATTLSRDAIEALINSDVPFSRLDNHSTDGNWKDIIPDRPVPLGRGMVYDWRLGVPALLEITALRLQVIAALDPNFKSDLSFSEDLMKYRSTLLKHYNLMVEGIKCGWKFEVVLVPDWSTPGSPMGGVSWKSVIISRQLACADIYTGAAAYKKLPPNQENFEEIIDQLRSEVWLAMPFFEMRSMIDTLYLYATGETDLTQSMQRIPVEKNQNLCLDVQWGNPDPGTPVWIWDCNGDGAQKWVYDRKSNTIRNPIYDKCLDIQGGSPTTGTDVWIWDCNGSDAQRWTYDPETKVLQSALGTVLTFSDFVFSRLKPGTTVWMARRDESATQRWHADPIVPDPPHTLEVTYYLYLPLVGH